MPVTKLPEALSLKTTSLDRAFDQGRVPATMRAKAERELKRWLGRQGVDMEREASGFVTRYDRLKRSITVVGNALNRPFEMTYFPDSGVSDARYGSRGGQRAPLDDVQTQVADLLSQNRGRQYRASEVQRALGFANLAPISQALSRLANSGAIQFKDRRYSMSESLDEAGPSEESMREYLVPGKSVLIRNVWWTIKKRDLDAGTVRLEVADFAKKDGSSGAPKQMRWTDLTAAIRAGKYGVTMGSKSYGPTQDREKRAKTRAAAGKDAAPGTAESLDERTAPSFEKWAKTNLLPSEKVAEKANAQRALQRGFKFGCYYEGNDPLPEFKKTRAQAEKAADGYGGTVFALEDVASLDERTLVRVWCDVEGDLDDAIHYAMIADGVGDIESLPPHKLRVDFDSVEAARRFQQRANGFGAVRVESIDEGEARDSWDAWKSWTTDERIVFSTVVGLKAGYGGDKDFRFKQAARATGITRDEWEAAKEGLIARKVFRKNGAVDPKWKRRFYDEKDGLGGHVSQMGAAGSKRPFESIDEAMKGGRVSPGDPKFSTIQIAFGDYNDAVRRRNVHKLIARVLEKDPEFTRLKRKHFPRFAPAAKFGAWDGKGPYGGFRFALRKMYPGPLREKDWRVLRDWLDNNLRDRVLEAVKNAGGEPTPRRSYEAVEESLMEGAFDRAVQGDFSGMSDGQLDALAAFGLGPRYVPKPRAKFECMKCGEKNAYWHEAHADTGMDEMVIRCPDCGHQTEGDETKEAKTFRVFESQLDEVDPVTAIGLIGTIGAGAGVGVGVVKALRTIKALLAVGKKSAAEKAYDKMSDRDRRQVEALIAAETRRLGGKPERRKGAPYDLSRSSR